MSSAVEKLQATLSAHLPTLRKSSDEIRRAYAEAFAELYPRLVRFAKARLGGDQPAAEEVAQDTLVRGWQNLGNFRGKNFLAWLFSIARNRCVDHGREQGKAEPLPQTPLPAPEPPEGDRAREVVTVLETFWERLGTFEGDLEQVSAVLPPPASGQGRPRQDQVLPGLVQALRNAVSRARRFLSDRLGEARPREK